MRQVIGFAGITATIVATVALAIGLAAAVLSTEASASQRLAIAFMPAVLTFVTAFLACLILCGRDYAKQASARQRVRDRLMSRHDCCDEEFLSSFPDVDVTLLRQTRCAVAAFFGVPVEKVHPTDNLHTDLEFAALEPGFQMFVMCRVLNDRDVRSRAIITFRTSGLKDIGDLAAENQRVLERLRVT